MDYCDFDKCMINTMDYSCFVVWQMLKNNPGLKNYFVFWWRRDVSNDFESFAFSQNKSIYFFSIYEKHAK